MSLIKTLFLLWAAFMLFLAFLCYTPLPEGVNEPMKIQLLVIPVTLCTKLVDFGAWLGFPSVEATIPTIQKFSKRAGDPPSSRYGDIQVVRLDIQGVSVILYRPFIAKTPSPAIVYLHGGGWTLFSSDDYDMHVYELSNTTNFIVVSVDYRLAPKHPFPIPFEDSYTVVHHILKHGSQYGIDVNKVGVAGDSAGANMAAAISLKLRDEAQASVPPLVFQSLHMGIFQLLDLRLPSYLDLNSSIPTLPTRMVAAFVSYYMGLDPNNVDYNTKAIMANRHVSLKLRAKYGKYVDISLLPERFRVPNKTDTEGSAEPDNALANKVEDLLVNPYFMPLMASNLKGLPKTYIHVAEFDVLRDDSLLFASRLKTAGVKVELYVANGSIHIDHLKLLPGFCQTNAAKKAFLASCDYMKKAMR